jgi:hypothetical protein
MARKHERSTFLTEILLESASGRREARISDVSEGGCFVDTIMTVRTGEEVSIISKSGSFTVKGKVAYVMDGFGFGVEFIDLSEESQQAINKILGK